MRFEFDPAKSEANKAKHGIDFVEAQALWSDPKRLIIGARSDAELRNALIARLQGKLWIAFYTLRDDAIRIISVRRARNAEERNYEEHNRRRAR